MNKKACLGISQNFAVNPNEKQIDTFFFDDGKRKKNKHYHNSTSAIYAETAPKKTSLE
ncbi:8764_t:CDS:2 [Funneliformis geosporum]|uniref:8764_t:CDS:1 n=1 Tax=Funneliformis geosporum TaxID=1117311 RepID=A0A9W4WND6_9GLOM|nr:8764_t:CDS:2 [Funneliformis geosporum]